MGHAAVFGAQGDQQQDVVARGLRVFRGLRLRPELLLQAGWECGELKVVAVYSPPVQEVGGAGGGVEAGQPLAAEEVDGGGGGQFFHRARWQCKGHGQARVN
ncbi:uncharacterized protein PST29_0661 [Pseudomonas sp. St29]|nr:uncharacterized protein PST29_0661 [Pseudomonas sp. St29]